MRFLVVGIGAIGGYVGGSLAAGGHSVVFLVRERTGAMIAREGLLVERGEEQLDLRGVEMCTDAGQVLRARDIDAVICALKAFDTPGAIDDLASSAASSEEPVPPVLSLQNGVDSEAVIGARIGPSRVIPGTVTTAVSVRRPGHVVEERHRGIGIALGHPLAEPIADALNDVGLTAHTYPAAGPMKWSKLLANLAANATSAITDLSASDVYADPGLFRVELAQLRECLAVMDALGYDLIDLPGTSMRALSQIVRELPLDQAQPLLLQALGAGRGAKMPSFHIDLHSGRGRTEVAYLHGAVVRHGATVGVPAPVCATLTETLEALTAGREDLDRFRHRPAELVALMPAESLGPSNFG